MERSDKNVSKCKGKNFLINELYLIINTYFQVLLTVRDPVKWYNSVKNTILQFEHFVSKSWFALPMRLILKLKGDSFKAASFTAFAPTFLGAKYPRGMFGAVEDGQETAVRFYNDWTESVKETISADRLLVFEVKQGWDPLCKFLDLPVPEEPFPNANDTAEQQARLRSMKRICFFAWTIAIGGLGAATYYIKDIIPKPKLTFN